jgi:GntR family transcriptional regulator
MAQLRPNSASDRRRKRQPQIALERESAHALYEQVADRLRTLVATAAQPGWQLPSEEELTVQFKVSRSTVRKAMQRLVDEAVLVRRRGKGTFVARPVPTIVHAIDRLAPFFETFRQLGEEIRTELIDFLWEENADLPKELRGWARPVLAFRRRYISRGVPHAITRIQVPFHIGRRLARADIETSPIYDVLKGRVGVVLRHAEFLVSCRHPSHEISEMLEISQGSLLLILDRITRDNGGQAVERTTHFLRPDVYQLSVVLKDLGRMPQGRSSQKVNKSA